MQGYIIDIKKVKDEDLIVTILTDHKIYTTYRFYGARHSVINVGYKIDFEVEELLKSNLLRLKDVLHINFSWIFQYNRIYNWQRYIKLFYTHLRDIKEIEGYYFNSLDRLSKVIEKQNPKRAICENYVELLEFEGRLNKEYRCLLCDKKIEHNISLVRAFMPTHTTCSYSKGFDMEGLNLLFEEKSTVLLTDDEVEYLYNILMQGL